MTSRARTESVTGTLIIPGRLVLVREVLAVLVVIAAIGVVLVLELRS
jgi:hypothetical protein